MFGVSLLLFKRELVLWGGFAAFWKGHHPIREPWSAGLDGRLQGDVILPKAG